MSRELRRKLDRLHSALNKITVDGEVFKKQFKDDGSYEWAWEDAKVRPSIIRERDCDAQLILSAEDGGYFASYYERGGLYIDPRIEKVARDHGFYFEWENPGALIAYEI